WVLFDKMKGLNLDPATTLERHSVENGQSLYLERLTKSPFIRVNVHFRDGTYRIESVSPDQNTNQFIADLVRKAKGSNAGIFWKRIVWNLENKDSGRVLQRDKTIRENGVIDGHSLYLQTTRRPIGWLEVILGAAVLVLLVVAPLAMARKGIRL